MLATILREHPQEGLEKYKSQMMVRRTQKYHPLHMISKLWSWTQQTNLPEFFLQKWTFKNSFMDGAGVHGTQLPPKELVAVSRCYMRVRHCLQALSHWWITHTLMDRYRTCTYWQLLLNSWLTSHKQTKQEDMKTEAKHERSLVRLMRIRGSKQEFGESVFTEHFVKNKFNDNKTSNFENLICKQKLH